MLKAKKNPWCVASGTNKNKHYEQTLSLVKITSNCGKGEKFPRTEPGGQNKNKNYEQTLTLQLVTGPVFWGVDPVGPIADLVLWLDSQKFTKTMPRNPLGRP